MRQPRKPARKNMFFVYSFEEGDDAFYQVLCDEDIGQMIVFNFPVSVFGGSAEAMADDFCGRLNDALAGWLFNWRNP